MAAFLTTALRTRSMTTTARSIDTPCIEKRIYGDFTKANVDNGPRKRRHSSIFTRRQEHKTEGGKISTIPSPSRGFHRNMLGLSFRFLSSIDLANVGGVNKILICTTHLVSHEIMKISHDGVGPANAREKNCNFERGKKEKPFYSIPPVVPFVKIVLSQTSTFHT